MSTDNERRKMIAAGMAAVGGSIFYYSMRNLLKINAYNPDILPSHDKKDPFSDAPVPISRMESTPPNRFEPDETDKYTQAEFIGGKRVVNEYEPAGLEFDNWGREVPVYDLTYAQNESDLGPSLNDIYSRLETSPDESVRGVEYFTTPYIIKTFNDGGINHAGFLNRHFGILNRQLKENKLNHKSVGLARIFVTDPKVLNGLLEEENLLRVNPKAYGFVLGQDYAPLPQDCDYRFLIGSDLRNNPLYYPGNKLSSYFVHELGHVALHLGFDLYPTQEPGGQMVETYSKDGKVIQAKLPEQDLPANWLMVAQSLKGDVMKIPILEPFSVEAIKQMKNMGIDTWIESYVYWSSNAIKNLPNSLVRFYYPSGLPIERGEISVFEADYKYLPEEQILKRNYGPSPNMIYDLDINSANGAFIFNPGGLPKIKDSDKVLQGIPNTWFLLASTPDGEYCSYLNSYDFLYALWVAQDANEPKLKVPTRGFTSENIRSYPLQSVQDRSIRPFSSAFFQRLHNFGNIA